MDRSKLLQVHSNNFLSIEPLQPKITPNFEYNKLNSQFFHPTTKESYKAQVEDKEKKVESLDTSMCLGKKDNKLDANYIDSLYARIKSSNKLLRQEAELTLSTHIKCNEHVRRAIDMENSIRNTKDFNKVQVLSAAFVEVIRSDPYYGGVLNEIKKGYDSLKDNAVVLEREVLSLRNQNMNLSNENRMLKKENEELKGNLLKNGKENVEFKGSSVTELDIKIKEVSKIKQLSPHILDTDPNKCSVEKVEKRKEDGKVGVRGKSVKVPRLDLSKVKNKYAGEKVVVAQEKNHFIKKSSEATLTENKSLVNDQSTNTGKFKNWKDLNSLYIGLCNKTSNEPKSLLDKFKRGIY
jgi:hypothetical protein